MSKLLIDTLRGGLIVSCQADPGSPLAAPAILAALAGAAEAGGAVGIRANGPDNVAAIARTVKIPVIGIYKVVRPGCDVYITPTFADAAAVVEASDPPPAIIAFDATDRPRPDGADWRVLLRRIKIELGALTMADVATLSDGRAAAEAGADLIATTLSGYTADTAHRRAHGPDLELVHQLASMGMPVICEGRIHSPVLARAAIEAGAHAVVVGTAITAIDWVTRRYCEAMAES